jgi:Tol biopolymer transport system component/DNA-binding winged helix-turn-helix (wHTH) protein
MSSGQHVVYQFGEFRLEPHRRLLSRVGGEPLAVTGKAFDALVYLVEHAGELVTRAALSEFLWPSVVVEENNLSQAVSVLRRALGEGFIATVARRGYQFTAPVRQLHTDASEHAAPGEQSATPLASERASAGVPPDARPDALRSGPAGRPAGVRRTRRRAVLMAVVGGLAILAAILWLTQRSAPPTPADPLDRYAFSRLTEFDGAEEHAAISRDGRFVAFLRERDGLWDAWVGQIGTDDFHNLTHGTMGELRNPSVRTLGFSPDGSQVTIWTRTRDPAGRGMVDGGWTVPTFGGPLQPYLRNIAELDWSPDGKRIAYHTAEAGDPMFIANADEKERGLPLYVGAPGKHSHFPLWSRDGRFVYFVHGYVPDEMDVWRMAADGAKPEQLTFHSSRVSFPAWLDDRTLLYLATANDGSGPWLHAFDLERRRSVRVDTHGREYASIAASVDGRRVVATEVRSTAGLWRAPLQPDGSFDAAGATGIDIRTPRGLSPRVAGDFMVYRAPRAGRDGIYKLAAGITTELWSGVEGRVIAGPALAPDGRRLAFPVQRRGRTRLYVMNIDGSGLQRLAEELDVRGAPSWSPDGNWIAIGAMSSGTPRLFKIPLTGGAPVALGKGYALDPAWSPSGSFVVFSTADVGTNFSIAAVNADGTPHELPPLVLSRGSRRLDFLDERQLVVLKGDLSHKELWAIDLQSGAERRLTDLGRGPQVQDFDISDDAREIVFDRVREESDIVLMELAEPPSR